MDYVFKVALFLFYEAVFGELIFGDYFALGETFFAIFLDFGDIFGDTYWFLVYFYGCDFYIADPDDLFEDDFLT